MCLVGHEGVEAAVGIEVATQKGCGINMVASRQGAGKGVGAIFLGHDVDDWWLVGLG